MQISLRWFGSSDPVTLENIGQIPGVKSIVSALHDLPAGQVWSLEAIRAHQQVIAAAGPTWSVVESIHVHEAIKLGLPDRDRFIACFIETMRNVGAAGIHTVCYNFMPVFDWMRTAFAKALPDGSNTMAYTHQEVLDFDFSGGIEQRIAWAQGYTADEVQSLFAQYAAIDEDALFENLRYFLQAVIPAAEDAGVRLAIHPDDPPWSIFGLPRIVRSAQTIQHILDCVDRPANGVTFCTGALGASLDNDLPAMIRQFSERIHFVHLRNVKHTSPVDFYEAAHPTFSGDVDMGAVIKALQSVEFTGFIRPDHGRMIWGETGIPGYGLYDRALGAMYIQGLIEGSKSAALPA